MSRGSSGGGEAQVRPSVFALERNAEDLQQLTDGQDDRVTAPGG